MKLRPYQEEAVRAVEAAWEKGIQRPLIAMPTGSGKTICFVELIRRQTEVNGNTAMVLAHRDELINQAVESSNPRSIQMGLEQKRMAKPDFVVDACEEALEKGKTILFPGGEAKFLFRLRRFAPGLLWKMILKAEAS